ncbi:MAG: hypothetical protein ACPKPY_08470 [Nitrososphaeraceae archaeon]
MSKAKSSKKEIKQHYTANKEEIDPVIRTTLEKGYKILMSYSKE